MARTPPHPRWLYCWIAMGGVSVYLTAWKWRVWPGRRMDGEKERIVTASNASPAAMTIVRLLYFEKKPATIAV